MNKKLIEIINCNERIANLYHIGPVHRAAVETFVEDIISLVADEFHEYALDEFLRNEGFIDFPVIEAK